MSIPLIFSKLLLLGDQITQDSVDSPSGVVPQLSKDYVRKLDVVNRGFSGYNTENYADIVSPVVSGVGSAEWSVIFLGNNDARNGSQSVSLSDYSSNLESIAITALSISENVVIVGQGIVNEDRANDTNNKFFYLYNRAAKEIADEYDLPFVDLWGVFRSYLNESSTLNPIANPSAGNRSNASAANATKANGTYANGTNSTNSTNSSGSSNSSSAANSTYIGAKGNPKNAVLSSILGPDGISFTDKGYDLYVSALLKVLNQSNITTTATVLPDYTKINSTETLPSAVAAQYLANANIAVQNYLNDSLSDY